VPPTAWIVAHAVVLAAFAAPFAVASLMALPVLLFAVLPALAIAAVIVYAGHSLYVARTIREKAARAPGPSADELVAQYARAQRETVEALAEGRFVLERARDALQKGIRG
jgi:uncharacterized membrane protein